MSVPGLVGSEWIVNTTNVTNTQVGPMVRALADGRFIIGFTDNASNAGDIRARIYNANAAAQGGEIAVTGVAALQAQVSIAELADGRIAVAYTDHATVGDEEIFVQMLSSSGALSGGPFRISDNLSGNQRSPDIQAYGTGLRVVFDDLSGGSHNNGGATSNGSATDIRATTLDSSLAIVNNSNGIPTDRINVATNSGQGRPTSTAKLTDGRMITVWGDESYPTQDDLTFEIADPTGAANLADAQISRAGFQYEPHVAALTFGGYVIAYRDAPGVVDGDIRIRIQGTSGLIDMAVTTAGGGVDVEPVVAGLADGTFVVAWRTGSTLTARLFNQAGAAVSDEFVVTTALTLDATSDGSTPSFSVAGLAGGRFVVTWSDGSNTLGDNNGGAVHARLYDPTLIFTESHDTVTLPSPNGTWQALGGFDIVTGTSGTDRIYGNANIDTLHGEGGSDFLYGGGDLDNLYGGADNDVLFGYDGPLNGFADDNSNDYLIGGGGADEMRGGGGDDVFGFETGDAATGEIVDGGAGTDNLSISGTNYFVDVSLISIEKILLTSGVTTFSASQLGNGLSMNLDVRALGTSSLDFQLGATNIINLSSLTFSSGWLSGGTLGIQGNGNANVITGSSVGDVIQGGGGSDQIFGGAGADQLFGAEQTDFLFFDQFDTSINGGADYDYAFFVGTGGFTIDMAAHQLEAVQGGAGADTINGSGWTGSLAPGLSINGMGGADTLRGGGGNDTIYFDSLDTVVDGGNGTDFAWAFGQTTAVTLSMLSASIEIAWGGEGGDTLNGASKSEELQIVGWGGNDVMTGGTARNIIVGGDGADQMTGGIVGDQLYFDHLDTVVNGGGGFDYAFVHNSAGVSIDYAASQIESVFGGFFNDNLDASGMSTTAYLLGNTGADQLRGGFGDDLLWFDADDTVVIGGAGYDTAYAYNVGTTSISMDLAALGLETVWGGFGDDILDASGIGSGTNVVLVGLGGADTLTGGGGNDTLSGGTENDVMRGNGGNDDLFAEGGTADVAVYSGASNQYTWTNMGAYWEVDGTFAGEGIDRLYNVELLRFLADPPGDVIL